MAAETLAEELWPLLQHYDVKWRGHGLIYVDDQHYNITSAHRVLADLSDRLDVPAYLIRSRLIELGWFNDVRRPAPVREGVERAIDEFERRAAYLPEEDDAEMEEEYDED